MMEAQQPTVQEEIYPPVPPFVAASRFLFVNVAAQRAKQLRRGALVRLQPPGSNEPGISVLTHRDIFHRLERVAMEEVRRGLIPTIAPPLKEGPDRGEA